MKKIIIPIIIFLLLAIGGLVYYFFFYDNAKATITLDINPSIEIKIDNEDKVSKVKALNDDARDIVSDEFIGKSLDDALSLITDNLVNKGYVEDYTVIIMHTEGKIDNKELEVKMHNSFDKNNIQIDIINVETITKEDKELAKEYNISPAKASYINSIKEDIKDIPVEEIVNKPVEELKETKESNKYCDNGYTLRGDFCTKEIERIKAKEGNVCPNGYYEYKGVCYEEKPFIETDKQLCNGNHTLVDGKCIEEVISNPEPEYHCDKGELSKKGDLFLVGGIKNAEKYYCVDKSNGKKPTLRCLLNSGHIMIGGNCYNGPAPTINGGCPNGDTLSGGWCYSKDNGDQWQCPDGNIYMKSKGGVPELCPDTFTYMEPTITGYKCEEGFTLENNKCIKRHEEDPYKERVCEEGYKMVDNDRCIGTNTKSKVSGYYCEDDRFRLVKNECVRYEEIDPKVG